mmetsp:Transcript_17230/g.28977  ORF Transcript_17230/g.28977 Transcript_17230/m.28977 type:complete len:503 (-) Transcript_17230:1395-2903(-)|eukprot:CAMPEP_0198200632 /NCGR_PEP_ID=MMETSP1445-20131203/3620_1 /TAXON_ID=36898 /ORGANISM="Pyramimonas sp., Strain CCMP2087" /LENGTH=502 /DNA_ID=CAMNT_0043870757 /DNA_START=187 /DNA_END=1695 /DNA_ORIENTATION=-
MAFGTVCLKEALRNRLIDVECELAMVRCLDLAHRKLKELPEDCSQLRGNSVIRAVDLTDNKLTNIRPLIFPPGLKILRLTGNDLLEMPCDITTYKHLKEVSAGANRLTDLEWLFKCRGLLYASVPCNRIESLPDSMNNLELLPLISLDLSYNNIADLMETAHRLESLRKLRSLILQGNPCALLPTYHKVVKAHLPHLALFDGVEVQAKDDDARQRRKSHDGSQQGELERSGSRLERAASRKSRVSFAGSVGLELEDEDRLYLKFQVVEIKPIISAADLEAKAAFAAAAAAAVAVTELKAKPKGAVEEVESTESTFHVEYCIDGIETHHSPTMTVPEDRVKTPPKKADRKSMIQKPTDDAPKDFPSQKYHEIPYGKKFVKILRDGMSLILVRSDPPPPPPAPEGGASETLEAEDPKPWIRTVLGEARLDMSAFFDGKTRVVSTTMDFLTAPALLDDKGHLVGLKGPQPLHSFGTASIKVHLHNKEPPPPPEEEEETTRPTSKK